MGKKLWITSKHNQADADCLHCGNPLQGDDLESFCCQQCEEEYTAELKEEAYMDFVDPFTDTPCLDIPWWYYR
jgi:Zn finger protein HypA/HybF involved in hydrogenase expression